MLQINELLTNQPAARPGTKLRKFTGITIHDTGNPNATANAEAHAVLLVNRVGVDTSWHYSVDQGAIFRSIPEDEVAWHAGDGTNGPGNNETISIESCVNVGNDYSRTMVNMADLCADILMRRGLKEASPYLFQHNNWSGKNCPAYIRNNGLWAHFVQMVQDRIVTAPVVGGATHTIVRGDTLWRLSRLYNITVEALKALNPGIDPNALMVGQVVIVAPPEVSAPDDQVSPLRAQILTLQAENAELQTEITNLNNHVIAVEHNLALSQGEVTRLGNIIDGAKAKLAEK